MLSIWKLRVGVENYYLGQVANGLEDYYSGRGEMPGRWLGAAAPGLSLGVERVDADALRAVLAGLTPGTGMSPNGGPPRTWKGRVPGFDLTFAAPKSVSVLYALGDPLVVSDVMESLDAAVDVAVAWLEREACFVRRGSNNRAAATGPSGEFGTRRLRGAGFVAAAFRHRTSRAGDPHLHTHVLLANTTMGPDGRWSALDATGLYRCKHTAGAVFRTALQDELTRRLGVSWRPTGRGLAEIAGIPAAVLTAFSKRRSEIEAAMAAAGVSGAAAAAEAMLATRTPKVDVDPATLRERWAAEAAEHGVDADDIDALLADRRSIEPDAVLTVEIADPGSGVVVEREVHSAEFAASIGEAMLGVDSTCTRHQITELVAARLPGRISAAALEQITSWVLAHPELIPLPVPTGVASPAAGWEQHWTTRRLVRMERDVLDVLDSSETVGRLPGIVVEEAIARVGTLGLDQAAAVRQVCGQGRQVEVVVGRAGSGKTFTMATVAAAYHAAGYRVVGVAPSARAARELAEGAGFESFTFPRFARHVAGRLDARHVVVVDEAAMAGTVDVHRVLTHAHQVGAKVILVGDHHQLPEVNAGGVFRAAVDRYGDVVAELTVNHRQRAAWEHDALDQLRHGHALAGFRGYADHGHVTLAATVAEVHTAAIDAWLQAHVDGVDGIVLAGTRSEARALNRLARQGVAAELSGPALHVAGRVFQAGDRVVLLANSDGRRDGHVDLDCHGPARLDNGMLATILAVGSAGSLDVRLVNSRRLRVAADYVTAGHVDHGYATTVHKAQGLTCDQVFVVGPTGLYREAVYVAMSRARHGAFVFATNAQAAELVERPHAAGIPLEVEHVDDLDHDLTRAIQQSRSKVLAHSHEPFIDVIAAVAEREPLDFLWQRHVELRAAVHRLTTAGYTDPADTLARLERARTHRRYLAPGVRVNAADWDNLGTIITVDDDAGTAYVEFTSSDRKRTSRRQLDWADVRPVAHPEPIDISDRAAAHFERACRRLDEHVATWAEQLHAVGLHPDELHIIPAAIDLRRRRLGHALIGDAPDWLTWWYGTRPADPAGAQVWDDEIGHVAAWRDARRLPADIAGYGPRPDDPAHVVRWEQHLDRSLQTRNWLQQHSPTLPPPQPPTVDIVAVRHRLTELDALMATAPPDQRRIVDAIHEGDLAPADLHQVLIDAAGTQHERRCWILEHWPHVVEHAELTRISDHHDPLAHWPRPPAPAVDTLYEQLVTISVDTPETATLIELDQRLADTSPAQQRAVLDEERDRLRAQFDELHTGLAAHDSNPAVIIAAHRERLTHRLAEIDAAARRLTFDVAVWSSGGRPRHLTDAVARRANHLAFTALATRQPWVTATLDDWHTNHPTGTPADALRLVTEIAAHRERVGHTGPDPLGPRPTTTPHAATWQHLQPQSQPPPRRTNHLISGR